MLRIKSVLCSILGTQYSAPCIDTLDHLGPVVPVNHSELGRLRQEDQKFKARLDNLMKCQNKSKTKAGDVTQWYRQA